MITVGTDVHVRNSYLHVTDDAGNVMRQGRYRNTLMGLAEFLGPIDGGCSLPKPSASIPSGKGLTPTEDTQEMRYAY